MTATNKLQALGKTTCTVHRHTHQLSQPPNKPDFWLHRSPCPIQNPRYQGNDAPRPAKRAVLDFHAGYQEQRSARTTGTSQRASHIDKQVQECALCIFPCRQMVPNTQRNSLGVDSSQNDEEETHTNHLFENTFSSKLLANSKLASAQRVAAAGRPEISHIVWQALRLFDTTRRLILAELAVSCLNLRNSCFTNIQYDYAPDEIAPTSHNSSWIKT